MLLILKMTLVKKKNYRNSTKSIKPKFLNHLMASINQLLYIALLFIQTEKNSFGLQLRLFPSKIKSKAL